MYYLQLVHVIPQAIHDFQYYKSFQYNLPNSGFNLG